MYTYKNMVRIDAKRHNDTKERMIALAVPEWTPCPAQGTAQSYTHFTLPFHTSSNPGRTFLKINHLPGERRHLLILATLNKTLHKVREN